MYIYLYPVTCILSSELQVWLGSTWPPKFLKNNRFPYFPFPQPPARKKKQIQRKSTKKHTKQEILGNSYVLKDTKIIGSNPRPKRMTVVILNCIELAISVEFDWDASNEILHETLVAIENVPWVAHLGKRGQHVSKTVVRDSSWKTVGFIGVWRMCIRSGAIYKKSDHSCFNLLEHLIVNIFDILCLL